MLSFCHLQEKGFQALLRLEQLHYADAVLGKVSQKRMLRRFLLPEAELSVLLPEGGEAVGQAGGLLRVPQLQQVFPAAAQPSPR